MSFILKMSLVAAFGLVLSSFAAAPPAYAASACTGCPNVGGKGLSRCFLCQAFKQGDLGKMASKGKKCTSAYCKYMAKKSYPQSKRMR